MPEFKLRFQCPDDLAELGQIELRQQALTMADMIMPKISEIFFGRSVVYEVRPFFDSKGMPDFNVTGWVTDKHDGYDYVNLARIAQVDVLAILRQCAYEDQSTDCWWQVVQGKWGEAPGLKPRPS